MHVFVFPYSNTENTWMGILLNIFLFFWRLIYLMAWFSSHLSLSLLFQSDIYDLHVTAPKQKTKIKWIDLIHEIVEP